VIPVSSTSSLEERVRRIEHSINYSEVDLPFPALTGPALDVVAGAPAGSGGIAVDRSIFRRLLPDARWVVYAAGLVNPQDANIATVSLVYTTDAIANVTLGSVTATGAGFSKKSMGPFDVFGTGGVPAGETIPVIRLVMSKNAGTDALFQTWTIWLRLLANKQ
jgi:hypothetical protein